MQDFEAELRRAMAAGCPTAAAVARQRRDRGATDKEHWGVVSVPSGGIVSIAAPGPGMSGPGESPAERVVTK